MIITHSLSYYFGLCLILISQLTYATATDTWLASQRALFKQAQQALSNEDLETFQTLSAQLQDYPIAHYLRYAYLSSHLNQVTSADIHSFLIQYADTKLASKLRQAWLTQLGKKGDWKTFLTAYQPPQETLLQCYYLQARLQSETTLTASELEEVKQLWLTGQSQPSTCDLLFTYLYDNNLLTNDLHWQRIRLAMQKGNVQLAGYVAQKLPEADQAVVTLWQDMYQTPEIALKTFKQPDVPISREILLHGLKRLAREDVEAAYNYWETYKDQYTFTPLEKAEFYRYLALKAASEGHPKASECLTQIDKNLLTEEVYQVRLKIALTKLDWPAVTKLIQGLPADLKTKLSWQYWQGRALEQTEHLAEAEKLFETLAGNRDYYGFLAAQRLGKPYQFQFQPLEVLPDLQQQLLQNSGMVRARELFLVGLTEWARDEWQAILPTLTPLQLPAAALLAHQWGWHHQAIVTLTKAQLWDALNVRFPLAYSNIVHRYAESQSLKPAWVFAILRQESAYQEDARSSAGALGLMQLLPRTAAEVANKHQLELPNLADKTESLFNPELNIQLGTLYLRELLDRFQGNHLLVTAAYNAGPARAKLWAAQYACVPVDVWVELIPFQETRDYVQRVMSYTVIFENQLLVAGLGKKTLGPMPMEEVRKSGCQ